MKRFRIPMWIVSTFTLSLLLNSCGLFFDPFEPGDHGKGGGKDTIVKDNPWDKPKDDPKDPNGDHNDDPKDDPWNDPWDNPKDTINHNPTDTVTNDVWHDDNMPDPYEHKAEGKVVWVEKNGMGFWGIATEDGRNFEPFNLPEEFQKDGTMIFFSGKVYKSKPNHGFGKVFEVEYIYHWKN